MENRSSNREPFRKFLGRLLFIHIPKSINLNMRFMVSNIGNSSLIENDSNSKGKRRKSVKSISRIFFSRATLEMTTKLSLEVIAQLSNHAPDTKRIKLFSHSLLNKSKA